MMPLYVAWFFFLFRCYVMPWLLGYSVMGMLSFPLETPPLQTEFIGPGAGRWRVIAVDAKGREGTPSAWRYFRFDDTEVAASEVEGIPIVPYDPEFLGGGHRVPIPTPTERTRDEAFEDGAPIGYLHYSLVLNEQRSLAALVAINCDRSRRLNVPRTPGLRWILDPRLPRGIQRDQFLYDRNDWDRGHLVSRRFVSWEDPNVSDPALFERAVSFYSATAPQHANFNRSQWLAIESHLLDSWTPDAARIVVFAGPVLDDSDPEYRSTRIPIRFWMVGVAVQPENPSLLVVHRK